MYGYMQVAAWTDILSSVKIIISAIYILAEVMLANWYQWIYYLHIVSSWRHPRISNLENPHPRAPKPSTWHYPQAKLYHSLKFVPRILILSLRHLIQPRVNTPAQTVEESNRICDCFTRGDEIVDVDLSPSKTQILSEGVVPNVKGREWKNEFGKLLCTYHHHHHQKRVSERSMYGVSRPIHTHQTFTPYFIFMTDLPQVRYAYVRRIHYRIQNTSTSHRDAAKNLGN